MTNEIRVCIINLSVLWGELMNINISKLVSEKTESIDINLEYDLKASNLLYDYNIVEASPISLSGEIYKEREKIFIDGSFSGEIVFRCSRCVREFKKNISGNIEFDIQVAEDENNNNDDEYLKGDYLDLSVVLEEALAFSLPMKVLCSEECEGLCPRCGQNLNINECNCDLETIDPRLEKLKDFFSNNEEV